MTPARPDLGNQPCRQKADQQVGVLVIERRPLEQRDNREHGRAEGGDLNQVSHTASLQHPDGIR